MRVKRQPGGQPGNQNARKHGFYSKILDKSDRRAINKAKDITDIDDEIALLRIKIRSALKKDPQNTRLLILAAESLARLMRAKYKIDKEQNKDLRKQITKVLTDVALPMGLGLGATLKKD